MSDTFCWCVSGAWAYLSCVFYVVSDVRCSHRASPAVLSVQIITNSPITELLSRFNCFKGKLTKKNDLSLFMRKLFDASLLNNSTSHWSWYIPSCIGDVFCRFCHISWICPEWCSCCVLISLHLSHLVGWYVRNGSMDWWAPAWLESAKRTLML